MTSVPEQLAGIRQLCQTGDWDAAARELRRLLGRPLTYSELARLNRTVDMVAQHAPAAIRQSRIAILGSSTTALLTPLLKALAFRDGIRAEVYEGLYGAYQQEILNPESGLYAFAPDVVILALNWRDLHLPPAIDNAQEAQVLVETQVARFAQLWQTLAERSSAHVIQYAFDLPAEDAWGSLSMALPGGRARLIHAVNEQLRREAREKSVSILDIGRVALEVGLARWSDPLMWWKAKQHPGPTALPELAEALLAQIRAICGLTRKVIAVDLDNTLWGGVIGEDGQNGIKVGPGTPEGEAHAALQQYLKELSMRGILLAVCSKNNPEDAQLPFGRHPGMVLRLEEFAAFVANWNDKATNLRAIADELSLGLDSFVFLDDNPMEREWIRAQLPQVAVPESGASVYGFQRALDRGRYFESLVLSKEDLARARQYRDEAQRRELQQGAQSMGDFLAGLKMQAACLPVTPANLERVTQLTNKTNQFNLTTRRYTRPQVEELSGLPSGWARAFQLQDCFGGYGLIGVIFCRQARASAWEIDTWLMSCRVLGRQMEQFMFDQLVAAAQMARIEELIGIYRPTGKNALVAQHYAKLAFTLVESRPEELRYSFGVPSEPWTPRATFIRLEP